MKPYFYYFGKTVLGLIAIAVFLYIYILNPENLNSQLRYFKGFNNCYILL